MGLAGLPTGPAEPPTGAHGSAGPPMRSGPRRRRGLLGPIWRSQLASWRARRRGACCPQSTNGGGAQSAYAPRCTWPAGMPLFARNGSARLEQRMSSQRAPAAPCSGSGRRAVCRPCGRSRVSRLAVVLVRRLASLPRPLSEGWCSRQSPHFVPSARPAFSSRSGAPCFGLAARRPRASPLGVRRPASSTLGSFGAPPPFAKCSSGWDVPFRGCSSVVVCIYRCSQYLASFGDL